VSAEPTESFAEELSSSQVDWWTVHQFVVVWLDRVEAWPMAGTPQWANLPAHDPRKWASLLDAARHWSLRVDTCQEAKAEAGRDVSGAADWKAIAHQVAFPPASRIRRRTTDAA
jgi:hypothetical protein